MKESCRKLHYVQKLVKNYNRNHSMRQLRIVTYSIETNVIWIADNLGTSASRIFVDKSKKHIKEQFTYV